MASRSCLILLLLLNYLLVGCVGMGGQHAPAARVFDYAHRPDCQLQNAWRGGACFDDCNGVQYHLRRSAKPLPLHQHLLSVKGMDQHCLPAASFVLGRGFRGVAIRPLPARPGGVPSGVRTKLYAPPRRG